MKFQHFRVMFGSWVDQLTGDRCNGVTGLKPDRIYEADSVEDCMKALRCALDPSPVLRQIEPPVDDWARDAVRRLIQ